MESALWWRRAFVAAAAAWAIVLPLAPYAASRPHGGAMAFGFAYGAYAIGSVICHQIPARSFHLWSAPLPVCARCTGIYVGAAVGAMLLLVQDVRLKPDATTVARQIPDATTVARQIPDATTVARRIPDATTVARRIPNAATVSRRMNTGPGRARAMLVAAAIPTVATLLYEWTTGEAPGHWVRALAGAPIGAAVAWIVREVN